MGIQLERGVDMKNNSINMFESMMLFDYELMDLEIQEPVYRKTKRNSIHKYGVIFGCMLSVDLTNNTQAWVLVTDDLYEDLSTNTQDFIVQHEIGHLVNKDTMDVSSIIKVFINRFLKKEYREMEYNADLYAAKMIGYENAKAALKELFNNKNSKALSKLELLGRIKNLKKLQKQMA